MIFLQCFENTYLLKFEVKSLKISRLKHWSRYHYFFHKIRPLSIYPQHSITSLLLWPLFPIYSDCGRRSPWGALCGVLTLQGTNNPQLTKPNLEKGLNLRNQIRFIVHLAVASSTGLSIFCCFISLLPIFSKHSWKYIFLLF